MDLGGIIIKTANQESIDIHQLGMWESQAHQAYRTFPTIGGVQMEGGDGWAIRDNVMNNLNRNGFTKLDSQPTYGDDGYSMNLTFRRRRADFYNDYMSAFNSKRYGQSTW